jgi:PhnB protein
VAKPGRGLAGNVLHARMNLGGTELVGADVQADRFQPMRSAYLSLSLDSDQEADRVFALLPDGGEIFMPTQDPSEISAGRVAFGVG